MENNLPLYKAHIEDFDESTGVDAVAFVNHPAIEKMFHAFNNQSRLFFTEEGDRRIVTGPLMLADMPIYRIAPDGREYYVQFDADTIQAIVERFFAKGNQTNVNLMHDGVLLDGITMFESMVIDSKRGIKAPAMCGDLPDGSWVGSFKVNNDEVWQMIKDGTLKGFSVEGIFSQMKIDEMSEAELQEIHDALADVEKFFVQHNI